MFLRRLMIAGGERDPGQQERAPCGGEPGGERGGRLRVAERQPQQRLQFIGAGQQNRPSLG